MMAELRRSDRLQMDETTLPVLAPGTGAVRKDWLWVVLRDQRGWGGSDPPVVVFHHSPSRGGAVAQEILKGCAGGTLLVDGHVCQTASNWDPLSASERDPPSERLFAQPLSARSRRQRAAQGCAFDRLMAVRRGS